MQNMNPNLFGDCSNHGLCFWNSYTDKNSGKRNGKHFIHEVVPELLDALESGSHSKNENFERLADFILFVINLAFKDGKNFSYHGSKYGQPLVKKVVKSYEGVDTVEFHRETYNKTRGSQRIYNYELLIREERHFALGFNLENDQKYSKKDLKVIEKAVRRIFSGNERLVAEDSRSSASVVIEWVREAADAYLASQRHGADLKSRTVFFESESFVEFSRRTNFNSKKIFCNSKRQVGITSAIYHWGMARNELSLSVGLRCF